MDRRLNKKEEFYKKEANMNKKEANKKENYKPIYLEA